MTTEAVAPTTTARRRLATAAFEMTLQETVFASYINLLCGYIHGPNHRWWTDVKTGQPLERNFGELMALITSELSEALEGDRKDLADDKLPHRSMREVELADAFIRLLDTAEGLGLDLAGAVIEKMRYNATRVDHTNAARLAPGGKRY